MLRVWHVRLELLAAAAVVAVLLYAGLAPFDLWRPNRVSWRADGAGLMFDGGGIAFTESNRVWTDAEAEGALTVELWLEPDMPPRGEATILAFLDEQQRIAMALTTRQGALTLRYPFADGGTEGTRAISVRDILEARPATPHYIAVTSGTGGTRVYVDGVSPDALRARQSLADIDGQQALRGRIVLGNAPQGFAGWRGTLRGLSLYARALTPDEVQEHAERVASAGVGALGDERDLRALYTFDEGGGARAFSLISEADPIVIPRWLTPLRRDVLLPIGASPLSTQLMMRDIALNVAGFIPLGIVLTLVAASHLGWALAPRFALVCLVGTVLSLGIELGQALLPSRFSSLLDLALNMLGTAAGASLATFWLSRRALRAVPAAKREEPAPRRFDRAAP
jgi:VanZ family protein